MTVKMLLDKIRCLSIRLHRVEASEGASGTVTSFSVTTANGVSGSVANASTTPAVTFTLGDINPSKIRVGPAGFTSTATPLLLDLGGTFTSGGVPNATANLKFLVFNDGTSKFGIGMYSGAMEYQVPASNAHVFSVNNIEQFRVAGGAVSVAGVFSAVGAISTSSTISATGNISTGGSISAIGSITGFNLSGINTGDQTNITGNSGTATALATPRAINGVNFDGTAPITVTAAGSTLSGTSLASNILTSSLTQVGTLATLTVTAPISGSITGNAGTVTTNANLTGIVTSVGNATSIADGAIGNAKLTTNPLARANHTGTQAASTITGLPVTYGFALSDLTTALVAGTYKAYWDVPHAMTLTGLTISVLTAPTGAAIIVDMNVANVSILSTRPQIDVSEFNSSTGVAAAFSTTSLAAGDRISFDLDQIGSTVAGAGLIATITGNR